MFTFEAGQDLSGLWVFFDILNIVDENRHLGEEGIVVREMVGLLRVTSWAADV